MRVVWARDLRRKGYRPADLAEALRISRASIYRPAPSGSDGSPPPRTRRPRGDDDEALVAIKKVASAHPRYGTRRIRAVLGRQGLRINRKKIQRIMRAEGLLVPILGPHPKPEGLSFQVTAPDHLWQTDLTKFWAGPADGWCYVSAVIDCCTREVMGYAVTRRCRSIDVLQALHAAVERRFPGESDVRRAEPRLRRDHGSQFSSRRYRFALDALGITGELTYYRHPDGNAFIERFFGTLKDEEIWCRDSPTSRRRRRRLKASSRTTTPNVRTRHWATRRRRRYVRSGML
jgi:putative transposase